MQTLIHHKANVDAVGKYGDTALFYASTNGNCETMKLLISNGADINILDHNGASATIWAIQYEQIETTKMLIESNAELDLKSFKGNTAFSMALWKGEKDIMNIIINQVNKNWIRKGPNQFKNIHTQEWCSYNPTGVPYIFVKTINIPTKKKYRNRTNLDDSFNDCSSINGNRTNLGFLYNYKDLEKNRNRTNLFLL